MQDKFFAESKQSVEWLRGISDADWETTYISAYGSMTAGEIFSCWVTHDNLHVHQRVELRRARIEKITKRYPLESAGDG
jgi:hypothetical protein